MKGLLANTKGVQKLEDRDILILMGESPSEGMLELINKYHAYINPVVSRILYGRNQDIEECISDTFVRIWKYWKKGSIPENTGTLKGLVMVTARNAAISRYKILSKNQPVPLEDAGDFSDDTDILETIVNDDINNQLQHAVAQLPEPDRQIFFSRYFLFESIKEISVKTGCTENQVKNRLHRGQEVLKQSIITRGLYDEPV